MLQAKSTTQAPRVSSYRPEDGSGRAAVEPALSAIDEALVETFPASDPPAWMPGLARPAPPADDEKKPEGVIEVSRPPDETPAEKFASLIGAMGLSLIVPIAVLAVGLPLVLGVRGVLELAERLVALVR